jgi:hypothetical protein
MIIAGEKFTAGMPQVEAMKKLDKCCAFSGGTDPRDPSAKGFFITNKERTDILANIWFRGDRVSRLERISDSDQEPNSVGLASSLYRLLLARTNSGIATVSLRTETMEISHASIKTITFDFRDGRSIEVEILVPDEKQVPQVSLKEVLEQP